MTVPLERTLSRIAPRGRRRPCKGTETCEGTE